MVSLLRTAVSVSTDNRAFLGLVGLLERLGDRRANLLRVLTYHRVDELDAQPSLSPGLLSATPAVFRQQMAYLAEHYQVVSVQQVLDAYSAGPPLPPRAVLLTFDDAYRDFAIHAWPILRHYRLPATLFVPTAFPDEPNAVFWWDRLYQSLTYAPSRRDVRSPVGPLPMNTLSQRRMAWRRLRDHAKSLPHPLAMEFVDAVCQQLDAPPAVHHVLSWSELRSLSRQGLTLAPHTRHHPLMHRISLEEARAEAIGSLEDLRREIGFTPAILAYPGGGMNEQLPSVLQQAGFELAFTTCHGINALETAHPLQLRRIHVGRRMSTALWRAQLLPWSRCLNGRFDVSKSAE